MTDSPPIRVLLVDDEPLAREMLREMLQGIVPMSSPPALPPQEKERSTEKEIHDMLKAALERLMRENGGT